MDDREPFLEALAEAHDLQLSRRALLYSAAEAAAALAALSSRRKRKPRPAPTTASPASGNRLAGRWLAKNPSDAGMQALQSVEIGSGDLVGNAGFTSYPKATQRTSYKIATESAVAGGTDIYATDKCKSCVSAEQLHANPALIALHPATRAPLHSFSDSTSLFMDLGAHGAAALAAQNSIAYCRRRGIRHLYLDNMCGFASGLTAEGVVPAGYASDRDWRYRAVIPFIDEFSRRARNAGIYTIMSLYDWADPALGEREQPDEHTGATRVRFLRELKTRARHLPDALFWEYFLQKPTDREPYAIGEDAWYDRWQSNLARVDEIHALGLDFHGMNWHNNTGSGHIGSYVRGSLLLKADLTRGDTYWCGPDLGDGSNPFADPDLLRDPGGAALGPMQQTGNLRWRRYPNFLVVVNPSRAQETQVVLGKRRTVPGLTAIYADAAL
jgi:hypothetical protein